MRARYTVLQAAISGVSLTVLTATGFAAEYPLKSAIDAVTVFPSEATVERVGKVGLEEGDHVVRLAGLPARLDPASVRVSATAGFAVEIGSVDVKRVVPPPLPVAERTAAEQRIEALQAERAAEADRRTVAEGRLRFVDSLTRSAGEGFAKGLGEGKLDPKLIRDVIGMAADESAAAQSAIRAATARLAALDIEIEALARTLRAEPSPEVPSVMAAIALTSRGRGEVTFRVEYRVPDAGWRPVYEARLATGSASEKPTLDFATRAAITQRSGEDWANVALTLSTTRPSRGTGAGQLPVVVAQMFEPRPVGFGGAMKAAPKPFLAPAPDDGIADQQSERREPAPPIAPVAAVEREAEADVNGLSVVYRIPGRAQVPGQGETKTLKVSADRIEPALSVRAVPKLMPAAYLTAAFAKPGEAGLLPGNVTLFRDGIYVGQGALGQTAPGETVKLGFGEDPRIKIDYAPLRNQDGETGTFTSSRTQRRDTKISVRNLGAQVASVTVEDQLPVSENTDIRIEPLASNTQPSQTGMDGRRGAVAWSFDLKPGEAKDIRFGWQTRWPADKQVRWVNVPK